MQGAVLQKKRRINVSNDLSKALSTLLEILTTLEILVLALLVWIEPFFYKFFHNTYFCHNHRTRII
jgi:hypothetical protein